MFNFAKFVFVFAVFCLTAYHVRGEANPGNVPPPVPDTTNKDPTDSPSTLVKRAIVDFLPGMTPHFAVTLAEWADTLIATIKSVCRYVTSLLLYILKQLLPSSWFYNLIPRGLVHLANENAYDDWSVPAYNWPQNHFAGHGGYIPKQTAPWRK